MSYAALLDSRSMWYATRATGVVSLVLLTGAVVLGVTEVVRWASPNWPRFITAALHRNVSLLATAFIAAHIATAIVDGFAPIGWLDAVLPFHSPYRPLWLGLGTVAFDLLLALVVTSLLRRRIGPRLWRAVHWGAYACWPVALLHGIGTGTDTSATWAFALEAGCLAAVMIAVWWRIAAGWPAHQGRRLVAATTCALAPLLIAAFAFSGPLQPGWARKAGTPSQLLAASSTSHAVDTTGATAAPATPDAPATVPAPAAAPAASSAFSEPFNASVSGTVTDTGAEDGGQETITIDAQLRDGASGSLHIVLRGRALDDGGVALQTSDVRLDAGDGSAPFTGQISSLWGGALEAELHRADGSTLSLFGDLGIGGSTVTGTVRGEPQ